MITSVMGSEDIVITVEGGWFVEIDAIKISCSEILEIFISDVLVFWIDSGWCFINNTSGTGVRYDGMAMAAWSDRVHVAVHGIGIGVRIDIGCVNGIST